LKRKIRSTGTLLRSKMSVPSGILIGDNAPGSSTREARIMTTIEVPAALADLVRAEAAHAGTTPELWLTTAIRRHAEHLPDEPFDDGGFPLYPPPQRAATVVAV
jgi:hypothetical protein